MLSRDEKAVVSGDTFRPDLQKWREELGQACSELSPVPGKDRLRS